MKPRTPHLQHHSESKAVRHYQQESDAFVDVIYIQVRTPIREVYGGERSAITTAASLSPHRFRPRFLLTAKDDMSEELSRAGIPHEIVPVGNPLDHMRGAGWAGRLERIRGILHVNDAVFRQASASRRCIVHAN